MASAVESPNEITGLYARQYFQPGCPAATGRASRRRPAERDVFADMTSGSKTAIERPGMKKLLEYAQQGDTVVVWRVGRLGHTTTANASKEKPTSKPGSPWPDAGLNVLWAMLRDGTAYMPIPATARPLSPTQPHVDCVSDWLSRDHYLPRAWRARWLVSGSMRRRRAHVWLFGEASGRISRRPQSARSL